VLYTVVMNWNNAIQIVDGLIILVGIPVIVNMFISIGKKLQVIDSLDDLVRKNIQPDLKDLRERFVVVEDRVKSVWKDTFAPASSPRQLNIQGENILEGSGIKEIIDDKKNDLFAVIKSKNISNPYDAEQCILSTVNELKNDAVLIEKLKTGAFSVGADIDSVLLVGGIYLRNLIFNDLGFSLVDLDKPKAA